MRPEIPTPPKRCADLTIDGRGYPVPWFVQWLNADGEPAIAGHGDPEFRVMSRHAFVTAITQRRCWVCGQRLGRHSTFVVGPMCVVNRVSAEPPSHLDCADWAARACPFLTRPHARRRDNGLPELAAAPAGIMIERNPGVTVLWTTLLPAVVRDPDGGILFDIGEPEHVRWYYEGRTATHDEIVSSIETGLPALRAYAQEPDDAAALDEALQVAMKLVPAE